MNAIGLLRFRIASKGNVRHVDPGDVQHLTQTVTIGDVAELFGLRPCQTGRSKRPIGEDDPDVRTALEDFPQRRWHESKQTADKDRDGIDSREFSTLLRHRKPDSEMSKIMKKNSNAAKMVALVVAIRLCITDTTAKRSDLETAPRMFRKQ